MPPHLLCAILSGSCVRSTPALKELSLHQKGPQTTAVLAGVLGQGEIGTAWPSLTTGDKDRWRFTQRRRAGGGAQMAFGWVGGFEEQQR